ncbi:MAG: glycosyltransferase [Rickettsiales bacterium]
MKQQAIGKIVAVLVTYNIGESVHQTVNSIKSQVDGLIIIDNGSHPDTLHILRSIVAGAPEFYTLIERTENNLAAAQNAGIAAARAQGADWVILSDHDSFFDVAMVHNLATAYQNLSDANIALLAPALFDRNSERGPRYLRKYGKFLFKWTGFENRPYLDDLMCAIASGSLISMQVLDQVGGMDETYGIDDVDREFCLRLITNGYKIVAVRDALLYHQLGHCRDHKLMGVRLTTSNHEADRRYTIYRNRIRNWRRYGRQWPGFVLFDILAMKLDFFRILVCESGKLNKMRNAIRGAFQGLTAQAA